MNSSAFDNELSDLELEMISGGKKKEDKPEPPPPPSSQPTPPSSQPVTKKDPLGPPKVSLD
jgi:hypothetical protein